MIASVILMCIESSLYLLYSENITEKKYVFTAHFAEKKKRRKKERKNERHWLDEEQDGEEVWKTRAGQRGGVGEAPTPIALLLKT